VLQRPSDGGAPSCLVVLDKLGQQIAGSHNSDHWLFLFTEAVMYDMAKSTIYCCKLVTMEHYVDSVFCLSQATSISLSIGLHAQRCPSKTRSQSQRKHQQSFISSWPFVTYLQCEIDL